MSVRSPKTATSTALYDYMCKYSMGFKSIGLIYDREDRFEGNCGGF